MAHRGTELSPRGYSVPKASLGAAELEALRAELTFRPKATAVSPSPDVCVRAYGENAAKIYVPKFFGLRRFGPPARDALPAAEPIDFPPFRGTLNAPQQAAASAWIRAARDPARMGGIINVPCGFGKTVVALHLVAAMAVRTLVVVHKEFLLEQWRARIVEFLGEGVRVGVLKASTVDVRDRDIVIASLQSLSMKEYPPGTLDGFGLLVVDEVHRTGTEVFSRALARTCIRFSLGLSATVQRKDGLTALFTSFLGDVAFRARRPAGESVRVVMREFFDPDPRYSDEIQASSTRLNLSRMLNNVCEFAPRTSLICDYIRSAVAAGRKTLVLSDRKAQLRDIHERLSDVRCGMYVGGMKKSELAASEACDVILATYSFASEGFDVRALDTLVLASPKTDIEQSIGRILRQREADRVRVPMVFDVVDAFSVFEVQARKRAKFYKRHGYAVEWTRTDGDVSDAGAESADGDAPAPGPGPCMFLADDDDRAQGCDA